MTIERDMGFATRAEADSAARRKDDAQTKALSAARTMRACHDGYRARQYDEQASNLGAEAARIRALLPTLPE